MDKSMIKNTVILTCITLIAGLALGITYEVTKEPIAKANEEAKQEAYLEVFSSASYFEEMDIDLEEVNNIIEVTYSSKTMDEIMLAYDQDDFVGYVFTITSHDGYGGDITYSVGITKEGVVNAISILSISETAGLGMNATEDAFKDQFNEKVVDSFEVVKTTVSEDNQIQAISGATVTSEAVTSGVNACLLCFEDILGGFNNE
ncbi:RnfABCDGE type electron transport complex subunit G [Tannockella kyphosi]|uniref:RnfABCDGE type electron transport complex subunit G n=1 Tax=Tannockella kyphosi TaxID=2899121 RepID=UPI0020119EDB|nr:RnfABCDGE type electron transport complex subunit G [Tannockella kyphosi]